MEVRWLCFGACMACMVKTESQMFRCFGLFVQLRMETVQPVQYNLSLLELDQEVALGQNHFTCVHYHVLSFVVHLGTPCISLCLRLLGHLL